MNKPILHLSENFQLKSADLLIKKLQLELGMANSYIDELENDKKELEEKVAKLETQIKNLIDKYSKDVNEFLRTDLLYQKFISTIDRVTKKVKHTQEQNEKLIIEISKLRNERDNKEMV